MLVAAVVAAAVLAVVVLVLGVQQVYEQIDRGLHWAQWVYGHILGI